MLLYLHLYLSLFLYPSTATARLLPRHPRPLPPPASTALCQIMPSESCDPLSPKTGKGHSERPAQTSGVCSGTSRLSTNLPWPCTKPYHETRKRPSHVEKHQRRDARRRTHHTSGRYDCVAPPRAMAHIIRLQIIFRAPELCCM